MGVLALERWTTFGDIWGDAFQMRGIMRSKREVRNWHIEFKGERGDTSDRSEEKIRKGTER